MGDTAAPHYPRVVAHPGIQGECRRQCALLRLAREHSLLDLGLDICGGRLWVGGVADGSANH